uniref:Uncharacterized protein n=1 Tax=Aegilops tauschii subsp. strangulata TaxID=200361 RepID=A0A453P3E2_AEGTS
RSKDTKERLAGVERLHEALEAAARRGLTAAEVTALVDTCMDLTRDANFRVAQGGLHALSAAAVLAGDHFKIHLNALVPAAVERASATASSPSVTPPASSSSRSWRFLLQQSLLKELEVMLGLTRAGGCEKSLCAPLQRLLGFLLLQSSFYSECFFHL